MVISVIQSLVVSELNDHIEENEEMHLTPEEGGGTPGSSPDVFHGEDDKGQRIYLHSADPLFHYANSSGLFPDDYQHILDSLDDSSAIETSAGAEGQEEPVLPESENTEEGQLPGIGPDLGVSDEDAPEEQEMTGKGYAYREIEAEEEEPGSAFVQWLNRTEKPRALGEKKARKKGKKENETVARHTENARKQTSGTEHEPVLDLESTQRPVKPKKGKGKRDQGVQLSPDVISETLAEVLAGQGHIHAAIEMYEKLGLIYPEKKSFFAVKIENLKNI